MQYIIFGENQDNYDIAILCKTNALQKDAIDKYYRTPLIAKGIGSDNMFALSLSYGDKKKPTAAFMKEYLTSELLPILKEFGVKVIYCTDGNYMKALTKKVKVDPLYGYTVPCVIQGYEDMQVIYSANHLALFANDKLQSKIDLANKTTSDYLLGNYQEIGTNIIKYAKYVPCDPVQIREALQELHQYDSITCDTETFSLRHSHAGLGTIGFAWNENEGICIDVEHLAGSIQTDNPKVSEVLQLLREFFTGYKGNIKYHNATYDIKVLIYKLWMDHLLDTKGLLEGLEILTRDFDCTKILTYLATNSCAGNKLSLKEQSHEFAGDYAQEEINDITLIPNDVLMKYNLTDNLSTWFVWNKHLPTVIADEQWEVYIFFKKILKNIIQMELTGMPLNMERVKEVEKELLSIVNHYKQILDNSPLIKEFSKSYRQMLLDKWNAKLKKEVRTLDDVKYEFNVNSGLQLIDLLHGYLKFEVFSTTKTGLPAVGGDELKGHMKRSDDPVVKETLEAIIKIQEGEKILGTFISKFLEADEAPDGWHYLFGSFNLGGTKSGRLSSSNPNLQNLPSGSTYGKLVKSCFQAPDGWLFVGLDYASLEDRINTLLTKDPNKVKVYTDGFDGHSYRAVAYWPDKFPQVDVSSPVSVNAIQESEMGSKLRSKSKAPTFALTYQGTWATLVSNCGFTIDEAKTIEANYHDLYKVSTAWVQTKLEQASIDGYITLAFGLRLRCPILSKTILGNRYTPRQASAESRTAGNAVSGQSYGLLNSRAGVEFQERTIRSKFKYDVRPCAQIHDATYFIIRNTIETVEWVNNNLVECVEWQELPEIQHDEVKLTGNLGIFYPNWSNEIELQHNLTPREIVTTSLAGKKKYEDKLKDK